MIIPVKTFEEMNKAERREYLEGLIEDVIFDQDGSCIELNEIPLDELIKLRKRRPKAMNRDYFTCKEIAEKVGRSRDSIRKLFWNEPGIKKEVHAGRNRRTYVIMSISKVAAKRRFPDIDL